MVEWGGQTAIVGNVGRPRSSGHGLSCRVTTVLGRGDGMPVAPRLLLKSQLRLVRWLRGFSLASGWWLVRWWRDDRDRGWGLVLVRGSACGVSRRCAPAHV